MLAGGGEEFFVGNGALAVPHITKMLPNGTPRMTICCTGRCYEVTDDTGNC